MAQSMIHPLINKNLQAPSSIAAFDVSDVTLERLEKSHPGIQIATSISDAINDSDLIVYAVKPQNVEKVHNEIRKAKEDGSATVKEDAILLSIMAGLPISNFVDGSGIAKVARSMPNTPAQIGAGVTVWGCTDNIHAPERKKIKAVLDSFGRTVYVEDESFIDMSTSISGSGPAYIFLLMEAMIDAGVHMGFSRDTATTLVHHTLLGSTKFAMETGEHPAVLRNSVTSPAGTTASAIYELENGKFRTVIKDAIWACYRRSLEMGGHSSQVGPGRTSPSYGIFTGGIEGGTNAPVVLDLHDVTPEVLKSASSHHPKEPPAGEMSNKIDENRGKDKH
eukprot:CAMPEP_0171328910 /NCGR_PEP_ID=MMETSP0878-20121228/918_1 /TAXON_ID=67004 /ORGANISM="Thalassiosira weissflogii, Strain CCMP1336" /LENGTH=334 /DNA_ID=CAMNT_0011828797 /DNA_START=271 /DNA_END=1275 /DNA_ORIENTATION=-